MTVKSSERNPEKTCNADGCNAWATKQSGRKQCRNHGGESTGPPQGNQNAMAHGLKSDPVKLLEHLRQTDEKAYAWIQDKFESYLKAAPFQRESAHADQLLQICVREYSIWKASQIQVNNGILTTEKKVAGDGVIVADVENPASKSLDRMERTVVKRLEKLGVMPSPEQQKADNMEGLAEMWASELED